MQPSEKFFMVARKPTHPQAKTTPKVRYATDIEAHEAAQKLANATGNPFVVLEAIATVRPKDTNQKDMF
jgi:hypothetical protein